MPSPSHCSPSPQAPMPCRTRPWPRRARGRRMALQRFERAAKPGLAWPGRNPVSLRQHACLQHGTSAGKPGSTASGSPAVLVAAGQGHADAQRSLGILFLAGSDMAAPDTEARTRIGRAADQGPADAKAYLRGAPGRALVAPASGFLKETAPRTWPTAMPRASSCG